jgi:5-methylthioribose kinase
MAAETAQFDEEALRALLAARPDWSRELGGSPSEWRVREVGDGNVNFVFEAAGPRGRLCVKHAAPFIRVVRQFALSPQRIRFEARAAEEAARAAPARVPRVVGFDAERGVLCLEWLSPHVVLRRALMAGTRLPLLAEHLGTFLARTLFRTSDLALRAEAKRRLAQEFAENAPMCRLVRAREAGCCATLRALIAALPSGRPSRRPRTRSSPTR